MGMMKFSGLFSIVPTTIFLCISFFVLVVLRSINEKKLKIFGFVVVALLCISAVLIFSTGIYTMCTGRHPMKRTMKQRMYHPMMQE